MKERPIIGLALSGASGRAITHIGVLEVLQEHNIPIDYITATSSGSLVAASFACGTMQKLKQDFHRMNKRMLLEFVDFDSRGSGIFSLEKAEALFRQYTLDKNFQDVRPLLTFVACDIETGEPVQLNLGDMARAVRISCAAPGVFAPAEWGNRLLVDGGLSHLVPVEEARQMGADVIIGVDVASTRYLYKERYIYLYQGLSLVRKAVFLDLLKKAFVYLKNGILNLFGYETTAGKKDFDFIELLSKSLEISTRRRKEGSEDQPDIMLEPLVKHYGKMDFEYLQNMYIEGRRAAEAAIPRIKKLIAERGTDDRGASQFETERFGEQEIRA